MGVNGGGLQGRVQDGRGSFGGIRGKVLSAGLRFIALLISLAACALPVQASTPGNVQWVIVSSAVLRISWQLDTPASEAPLVVLSTAPDFSVKTASAAGSVGLQATTYAILGNTPYYFKVKVATEPDSSYSGALSTRSLARVPTNIYFDEISTGAVTASAYSTGSYHRLDEGASSVDVALGGSYAGWRSGGNAWTSRANMLTPRAYGAGAVAGGRLYVIGGSEADYVATNEAYDPVTDAWTAKAAMPTARELMAAAVVDGRIYVVGGTNGGPLSKNEVYDPESNAWAAKAEMPTPRQYLSAAVVDGKLYAVGGTNANEMYDPAADSWTVRAAMPTADNVMAAAALNGKIYAAGGYLSGPKSYNQVYDPGTNSWSNKAALTTPRGWPSAVGVLGGALYIAGGYDVAELSVMEAYDPAANAWFSKAGMPTPRRGGAYGVIRGKLYAAGGNNGAFLTTLEEYDPGSAQDFTGLSPNTQYVFKARARNADGVETAESLNVSTYTLAAASHPVAGSAFLQVDGVFITMQWSSGSAAEGFNGPGARYELQASTVADFSPIAGSSITANLYGDILGLTPQTTYYYRVRGINNLGTRSDSFHVLGSTVTGLRKPGNMQWVSVSSTQVRISWALGTPGSDAPLIVLSTAPDFSVTAASATGSVGLQTTTYAILDNTSYYFKVKVATDPDTGYTTAIVTRTYARIPESVYFDEITTYSITASAYASGAAFSRMGEGASSVDVARDGAYAGWTVYGDSWTTKAAMPTARYAAGAVVVGGKLYVIGGGNGPYLADNEVYDPVTDGWTVKAAMPTARRWITPAVVGGKIYVVGGTNGPNLADNEVYDPVTDGWTVKAAMPTARQAAIAAVVSGKIYVIGGWVTGGSAYNEVYDPSTDAWTTKTAMPTPRYSAAGAAISGKIYVIGGIDGSSLADNEVYDPATDGWAVKAALPMARYNAAAAVIGGKAYVIGGYDGSSNLAMTEAYDPATDSWAEKTAMPIPRQAAAAAAVGGKIYVVGGTNGPNLTTNEVYDPGVARAFAGLAPNAQYSFKAKARDALGRESAESVTVSTYTLAAASQPLSGSIFLQADWNHALLQWSSGTAAAGFNGPGASYELQASTMADFSPILASSVTGNLYADIAGLGPQATYYYRVRGINSLGTRADYFHVLGSTVTGLRKPSSVQWASVSSTTVQLSWVLDTPASEAPLIVLSTASDFSVSLASVTGSVGLQTTSYAVLDNTSYYFKIKVSTDSDIGYTVAIVTRTHARAPESVYFDQITTCSITASAYASSAAFNHMGDGLSGVVLAKDGAYAGWTVFGDSWTTKASMPTARRHSAVGVIGGKIYVVGGSVSLTENEVYDPVTNAWTTKTPMPTGRGACRGGVLGGKLYVVGGSIGIYMDDNEVYDPVSDAWAARAPLSVARDGVNVAVVGDKLYAVGGCNGGCLALNEEYDPSRDAWTSRQVIPSARGLGAVGVVDGKIHVIGGWNGAAHSAVHEVYDPAANVWTTGASLPAARSGVAGVVIGGKIYALGGFDGAYLASSESYDPATDGWTARPSLPTARYVPVAAVIGSKIYVVGGEDGGDLAVNEAYDLGLTQAFTGLAPNTQYVFKAKARDALGRESAESIGVSTYTLAAASSPLSGSVFTQVEWNNISLQWSSGSVIGGFNGPGASYEFQTSTMADFSPLISSAVTSNLYGNEAGLAPQSTYYFRVRGINSAGTRSDLYHVLGSTVTGGRMPSHVQWVFVSSTHVNLSWELDSPASEAPFIALSTAPDFSVNLASVTGSVGLQTTSYAVLDNTSYYFKVKISTDPDIGYTVALVTRTYARIPESVYFDQLTTYSITASAYASGSAFNRMGDGLSGVSLARDGSYAGWTVFGDSWTTKANFPAARPAAAAAVVGGKLYVVGGDVSGASALNEVYDPVSNSWTTKTPMTTGRSDLVAAALRGRIYAVGGVTTIPVDVNESYDPVADSWSTKAPMPGVRAYMAAAVVAGKLYVVGGSGPSNKNEAYDPDTDAWSTKAVMSTARSYLAAAELGGTLFAVGGDNGPVLTTNEAYDPSLDAWSTKAAMPTARRGLAAVAAGGKLFAVGGTNGSNLAANEVYDPLSDSWSEKVPMPTARQRHVAAFAGGKIYVVGGLVAGNTKNEAYDIGVAQTFTGLGPNAQYSFKAKARDALGRESAESVTVSTYTLAAALPALGNAPFPGVFSSSITVAWSSGAAASGYNGPGASYLVQASTKSDFSLIKGSSLTYATSALVAGLDIAFATYYFRVLPYNSYGQSGEFTALGSTTGYMAVVMNAVDLAPAQAYQDQETAFIRFTLQSASGTPAVFSGMRIIKLGSIADADVSQAAVYLDAVADGIFDPVQDLPLGSGSFSGALASLNFGANAQGLSPAGKTFFVALKPKADAALGATLGARIAAAGDLSFTAGQGAMGGFPANSTPAPVQDSPNNLSFTPTDEAPASAVPSQTDVPMLKLHGQASSGGRSVIDDVVVYLAGTLPSSRISAVKFWRDADANGTLDPGADWLLGSDAFLGGVSTITMSAVQSSRTVTSSPADFFLSVDLAGSAAQGDIFSIRVATPSELHLAGGVDSVLFSTTPMNSGEVVVGVPNVVNVSFISEGSQSVEQGAAYAVLRATLTVDASTARIDRIQLNRSGASVDADVSAVRVYLDQTADGAPYSPATDALIGQAAFSGGTAVVDIDTVTLTAGATAVLFIRCQVSGGANPGDTLAASIVNNTYVRTLGAFTSVVGGFPFTSDVSTVAATVNTIYLTSLDQTGPLLQGTTNAAFLRLGARTDRNIADWSALTVERLGTSQDSDVAAVKVYRDENADGVLQTGVDSLLSSGVDVFSAGSANVSFLSPQSVVTSSRAYFVALSLSASAVPGRTVGVRVSTTASFMVNSPNKVSTGPLSFPIDTVPAAIGQYPNVVSVSTLSITPGAGALPGVTDIGVLRLDLRTDVSQAQWSLLRLDRAGTSVDADVSAVKVYYDLNGLGSFDSSNLGQYQLVSSSTMTFNDQGTAGTVLLDLRTPQTLGTAPKTYFVAVDLAASAIPGRTVVVRALNSAYLSVNAPNSVAAVSFTAGALTINAPPSTLYILAHDSAPASAVQGTSGAAMLSMNLWMDAYSGQVSGLTVARAGSGSDADLSRVRLFRDADADGVLSVATDVLLASGAFSGASAALTFGAETMTTSTQTWFLACDVSPTAAAGDTFSLRIGAPGAVNVLSPDSMGADGFPIQSSAVSVLPTMNGVAVSHQDRAPGSVLQGATNQLFLNLSLNTTSTAVLWSSVRLQKLGTADDSDVAAARIYLDSDDDGALDSPGDALIASSSSPFVSGLAQMSLSPAQTLGASAKRYFVALDLADRADYSKTLGLSVAGTASFVVPAPNYIIGGGFPKNSSLSSIAKVPDVLSAAPTSLLGTGAIQGSDTPAVKLGMSASRYKAVLDRVRADLLGSAADSDVQELRLYKDMDGAGAYDASDLFIGSAAFSGGAATVDLSSVQVVNASSSVYFAVLRMSPSASVGATVGLAFTGASVFRVVSPDSTASTNLPFQTGLASIMDVRTPSMPAVVMPDGRAQKAFESLRFTWASTVLSGSVVYAEYALGTSAGGEQVRAWTSFSPSQAEFTASGLMLLSGSTYYVSVRTRSDTGYTSPVGSGEGVLVDFVRPGKPVVDVQVGQNAVVLSWSAASAGPSGVRGYLVEYRKADSPLWYNARTNGRSVNAQSLRPAALLDAELAQSPFSPASLPSGTLFLRVSAVSLAGGIGDASDPVKVQFGALPPEGISGLSVYPNPFDSRKRAAVVVYSLSEASDADLEVYDLFGSKVRGIHFSAGSQGGQAGTNEVSWDGAGDSGAKVSMGAYLCVIRSGGAKAVKKVGVIH
ncbi:MAG: hypothetical protein WCU88_00425 [Elusimicrobiota bacterium]|jgi:N-acetylneuraminic acid mutarotase